LPDHRIDEQVLENQTPISCRQEEEIRRLKHPFQSKCCPLEKQPYHGVKEQTALEISSNTNEEQIKAKALSRI
jgi:hypothetical protein